MRERYVLADQIGAGGMGTVWRAWDRHERRWVAAKLVTGYDAPALARFVREQAVRVRHRHVVRPLDTMPGGLVMDLVRGGNVEQLLARHGPLPDCYVRVLLEQTLDALAAVHAAGVVHRDVKPGNLLLEPTGTGRPWVRLADFGVAARTSEPRLTSGGGVGTSGYLAPEQAAGAPPDPRQDLYSAGVVAIELLTGGLPGRPPPDGPLGRLLAGLTATDPGQRPATAAHALDLLRRLGVPSGAPWQDEPRPPDVVDLYADPRRPARGRRWRVPAYALAVPGVFSASGLAGGLASWLVLR